MPDDKQNNDKALGGFPSNNLPEKPEKETGNQNAGVEINRKTERSDDPEQA